ncbi:heterocyst differentiation ATP-binding protein HepA [mine drainage metagenome]|uniref:Heterocyst differentiation ATP-binding protein HepA n=1 Tax=mine drainage metagenome TaxID=410659 RepID=A0A1J5TS05_9ZZZZ
MYAIGRRRSLTLLAIACLMSVLDLVGIAIIFPFLRVVTEPDFAEKILVHTGIGVWAPSLMHKQVVGILGVALVFFYTTKTSIQSFLLRIQSRLLAQFTANQTNDVVSRVLNARYAVFQQTPASEIAGTAYANTVHASLALAAIIQAVNEGLLLILMFLGFIFIQPMLAFGTSLLAILIILLLYQLVIRRSSKIGQEQTRLENIRYRLLFAIASAIRDIKIMGLDSLFDVRNRKVSNDYAEIAWRSSFNNALPRLLIEFIALLAIVGFSMFVIFFDISLNKAGPLLGLIAIATVRAVPSMSKLFNAISAFRSSRPAVISLMQLRTRLANEAVLRKDDTLHFQNVIELKNIGFRYGEKTVLENVCLQLRRGESIGIVGPSGSGKTTLLDLFTGLQQATAGQFACDGIRFDPFTSHSIQKLIGYVPQTITLLDETIAFNVSFEEQPDFERVQRALAMANLRGLISSLQDGIQTRVGENGLRLSGGQRQRIGIARALYRSPEILVFDEATSSLDTLSEKELSHEIEKLRGQISVVMVAHRLSTVMACDRIYVLSNGTIESSGTHSELLQISNTYKKLYANQHAMEN